MINKSTNAQAEVYKKSNDNVLEMLYQTYNPGK
jgi:hypothetical protein